MLFYIELCQQTPRQHLTIYGMLIISPLHYCQHVRVEYFTFYFVNNWKLSLLYIISVDDRYISGVRWIKKKTLRNNLTKFYSYIISFMASRVIWDKSTGYQTVLSYFFTRLYKLQILRGGKLIYLNTLYSILAVVLSFTF